MKSKIFLLSILIMTSAINVFAQDEIKPELSIKSRTEVLPSTMKVNSENIDGLNLQSKSALLDKANGLYSNPYEKKSTSFERKKKFGKMSVGNRTDATFSPNEMNRTNTTYTEFTQGKFSVNTSYKNSTTNFEAQKLNAGSVSVTPEYKFNNRMSVQNSYSSNITSRDKKNEVMLRMKPFKDVDRMNFDVGASQIYSETSAPVRSQLKFQTKFNF